MKRVFLCLSALIIFSACGISQEKFDDLKANVARYEKKLAKQEKQVEKKRKAYLESAETRLTDQLKSVQMAQANMGMNVERIRLTVDNMIGAMDDGGVSAEVAQTSAEIAAASDRLGKLELMMIGGGDNKKMQPAPALPKIASSKYMWTDEKTAYDDGRSTYSRKEYNDAIAKLTEFLRVYPTSKYRPDVHYYLGETYFATGMNKEAIVQFGEVIQNYSKSSKTPMSFLRAGMAFAKLGNKEKAERFFKTLIKDFPGRPEADMARKELFK